MDAKTGGEAVVGGVAAAAAIVAFEHVPGKEAFKLRLLTATSPTAEPEKSPLAFIEHYHVGLAALTVSQVAGDLPWLDGAGVTLIGSELFGPQPFGIGKTPTEVSGNIALTAVLGGLLALSLIY